MFLVLECCKLFVLFILAWCICRMKEHSVHVCSIVTFCVCSIYVKISHCERSCPILDDSLFLFHIGGDLQFKVRFSLLCNS